MGVQSKSRSVTFAPLISVVLVAFIVMPLSAAYGVGSGVTIRNEKGARPELIFACDRPTAELKQLFTPALISDLQQLGAGVALSTEERAELVRTLNSSGIPTTAWLALARDEGYYVNASNASRTAARFDDFDRWTSANHLRWQAVGLDIEPTLAEWGNLAGNKRKLLSVLLRRAFDSGRVRRAREQYAALIRHMQSRGYYVQTYQLQFIADERRVHTTLLERMSGIVDVRGNEEVLMLYTSLNHSIGAGMIWKYGPEAQTIAVGSTASSGDPTMDAKFPVLNWDEFSRDVIVARYFSRRVGVYSLEGCVRQRFIAKLKTADWSQPVVIPAESISKAARFRRLVYALLWIGSHLLYFIIAFLIAIVWLLRVFFRWCKRRGARIGAPTTT